MSGLCISNAACRVCDDVRITRGRMDRSCSAHLSGEQAIGIRPERLSSRQSELVRDRRRRTAVTLEDLTSDGVVLSVEADAGGALDDDRDRERGDGPGIAQTESFFVEPWAARVD